MSNGRTYKLLPCPKCEGESVVETARETSAGSVIRRRRCVVCNATYHTRETILGSGRDAEPMVPATTLIEIAEQLGLTVDRDR